MEFKEPLVPELLTDKQTAYLIGVHVSTVWAKAKSGAIPKPIKFGGRTLWRRCELIEAIERAASSRDVA